MQTNNDPLREKYNRENRQTRFMIILDGNATSASRKEITFQRRPEVRYGAYRLDAIRWIMIDLELSFVEQIYVTGGRQGFWFFGVRLDKHRNLNFMKCVEGVLHEQRGYSDRSGTRR